MGNCCEPGKSHQIPLKSKTKLSNRYYLKATAITLDTDPTRWTG